MKYKNGFTLVELAIVLVIIGLLVGGILGGTELIQQSKLNKIMSDMDNYSNSIRTFELKYNALPGDLSNAVEYWGSAGSDCLHDAGTGTQTCNGDGDGRVDEENSDSPHESWRLWQHLSNAGLIKGSFSGIQDTNCNYHQLCYIPRVNVPVGVDGSSMFRFGYMSSSYLSVSGKNEERHVLIYSSVKDNIAINPLWIGRWHNASLSGKDQYRIDMKIDDGRPATGKIVDMSGSGYTDGCSTSDDYLDTTATYILSGSEKKCLIIMDY